MALIKLSEFEQEVGSFLPFVGSAIDFKRFRQVGKAIDGLYQQTDALAILLVQDIAAFLWWAAHIASAIDDVYGYSAEIKSAIERANGDSVKAWEEWLNVKYPVDLQALYNVLNAEIDRVHKAIPKVQRVNLRPLEKAIADLQHWEKRTVNPQLSELRTFLASWKRTYLPPINTLRHWLKNPSTFAKWATLPILLQTRSELQKPHNRGLTTSIALALTQTWTNDPASIFDAVTQWLITGE